MSPLHCLRAKSNTRTRGQIECDVVTWFGFCFGFVRLYLRCGCCSIVCLRFEFVQIKQIDSKVSTKIMNDYNKINAKLKRRLLCDALIQ